MDSNTAVTYYLVCRLVGEGLISKIDYGNSHLINMDELAAFFTKIKKEKRK